MCYGDFMNKETFIGHAKALKIEINDDHYYLFKQYYDFLVAENQKYNLTAITDEKEVFYKHFLDSLTILNHLDDNMELLDVGSGAGFPSIPLLILKPTLKVTIVDSLQKRINFLTELTEKLQLSNITLIHKRVEELDESYRERFDVVCARAVASLSILSELCFPFVKVSGLFIALKGRKALEELALFDAINVLGGKHLKSEQVMLPNDYGMRYNLVFYKLTKTALKYPRNFGQIKKRPLGVNNV